MHVVICSDGMFPASMGGIERHTRLLVESLAIQSQDLQITVAHTHPKTRFFGGYANVDEIGIEPKPGRRQYLLECIELSGRFAQFLRTIPQAVIYSQGICVLKDIGNFSSRLIVNPHGLESFQAIDLRSWATTTPFRFVQRNTLKNARFVVSLGGHLTSILRREVRDERRIVVIPNGVRVPASPTIRHPRANRPIRLLFVGRLAGNKGVGDLLAAVGILNSRGLGEQVHLDIAGAGPLLAQLKQTTREPNVRLWGKVSDEQLDALYRDADVFVLPTLFEGMPTVVLEAMARSLPVLVTDVGATRELVDDSNGKIIAKRNPAGLAADIRRFLELPPHVLVQLGYSGYLRAKNRFDWSAVASLHYELFHAVHGEMRVV